MTLLNICVRVADSVGLPRPSSVAGGTDQLSRQLFSLANDTLEELGAMDWPVLAKVLEFDTVAGTEQYPLPDDWMRKASDCAYVATQYYQMRGSLAPAEWQRYINGGLGPASKYVFRTFGDPTMINISPVPQTVEHIVIEYYTINLVAMDNGTRIPLFTADTDVSIIPEKIVRKGIKWRIKHAKGFDYTEDYNDYELSRIRAMAQRLDFGSMPVAVRPFSDDCLPNGYVPESGFG